MFTYIIRQTYRKDEVEEEEDVFADETTSIQSHDDQPFVLLRPLGKSVRWMLGSAHLFCRPLSCHYKLNTYTCAHTNTLHPLRAILYMLIAYEPLVRRLSV